MKLKICGPILSFGIDIRGLLSDVFPSFIVKAEPQFQNVNFIVKDILISYYFRTVKWIEQIRTRSIFMILRNFHF